MVLVLFAVAGVWPSGFQTLRSKSYYHAGSAFARALGGARGVQGAGPSSILTSVTPRAGTIALPKFASPEGDPRTPRLRTKFLSGHGGGGQPVLHFSATPVPGTRIPTCTRIWESCGGPQDRGWKLPNACTGRDSLPGHWGRASSAVQVGPPHHALFGFPGPGAQVLASGGQGGRHCAPRAAGSPHNPKATLGNSKQL